MRGVGLVMAVVAVAIAPATALAQAGVTPLLTGPHALSSRQMEFRGYITIEDDIDLFGVYRRGMAQFDFGVRAGFTDAGGGGLHLGRRVLAGRAARSAGAGEDFGVSRPGSAGRPRAGSGEAAGGSGCPFRGRVYLNTHLHDRTKKHAVFPLRQRPNFGHSAKRGIVGSAPRGLGWRQRTKKAAPRWRKGAAGHVRAGVNRGVHPPEGPGASSPVGAPARRRALGVPGGFSG